MGIDISLCSKVLKTSVANLSVSRLIHTGFPILGSVCQIFASLKKFLIRVTSFNGYLMRLLSFLVNTLFLLG